MKGKLWRMALCAVLILAMLAGMTGSVYAETVVTLDSAATGDEAGQRLSGLRVSGLSAPVAGQPRVERATVTSAEGMSWEIPVMWLDENGTVAEGIVWSDRLQPVLVFFLPEGYGM